LKCNFKTGNQKRENVNLSWELEIERAFCLAKAARFGHIFACGLHLVGVTEIYTQDFVLKKGFNAASCGKNANIS
jgi:hypothetical protein